MTMKEKLIAHKGEKGLTEKMNAEYLAAQGVELTDDELTAVSAAGHEECGCVYPVKILSDDRGDYAIEWTNGSSKYEMYCCPKCDTLLRVYINPRAYYCRSCDEDVDPTRARVVCRNHQVT